MEILEEAVGCFSVSCMFKNVVDQCEWAFTGVYGPNSDKDRRLLWEELSGLCSWWNVPGLWEDFFFFFLISKNVI